MKNFLWLHFKFDGRIARMQYLRGQIVPVLVGVLIGFLSEAGKLDPENPVQYLVLPVLLLLVLVLWIAAATSVKRFHDLGMKGAFALLTFVPLVNIPVGLYLFLKPGNPEPNDYGPPPA